MNYRKFDFPRTHRLLCRPDFQNVFSNSKRFSDQYFLIHVKKTPLPHARLGFAISRKHVPKAVSRNRLKRFVRESFRLNQNNLLALDFVVIARARAVLANGCELRNSIDDRWKEIILKLSEHPPKTQVLST